MVPLLQTLSDDSIGSLIRAAQKAEASGRCCPRQCGIDRRKNTPPCGAHSGEIVAASFHPHMGEEPPVSGTRGAGNIFLSGCALSCVFCQNFPFSHFHNGSVYSVESFCEKIRSLIAKGVHNLNLTTFDHYTSFVLTALSAMKNELTIPISNNCSGYFTPQTLELMISFCDIFLYDLKYSDQTLADKYSGGKKYVDVSWQGASVLAEKQIPWIEEDGILKRGVIFRHLVLPGAVQNTIDVLERLARLRDSWSDFRVSLMAQYFPAHRSTGYDEINRKLAEEEYEQALEAYDHFGFEGWVQELEGEGGC
jgi:putative pyruvate formate lyase activating enzyme